MKLSVRKWLQISLFNLLLVALLGVVMRYKIVYSLTWIDQRNLLHAHSHFAFAGWITQALMSLLVHFLEEKGDNRAFIRYKFVLFANLLSAYGMLFTFPFMGYKFLSILFSTLSIFASYWFAIQYWRDLDRLGMKTVSNLWFKAAVVFNALSSLGAFYLAYMLATQNIHPNYYLVSVYFFLHFQYNGWFFFACMGLFSHQLETIGISYNKLRRIYFLFLAACVPAYFLSALWLPVAKWLYILIVLAVILQLLAWGLMIKIVRSVWEKLCHLYATLPRALLILAGIALSIKLMLQAGSVIPSLSQLAFGFRPIVIGYLHLVLLGVITIFLLAYSIGKGAVPLNAPTKSGLLIFTGGIIFNEVLLMIQGIADMNYQPLPGLNELLLAAALTLFAGVLGINLGQIFLRYASAHKQPAKE